MAVAPSGSDCAPNQRLPQHLPGRKQGNQCIHQRMRLSRVVGTKIAHVHIHRDSGLLGPGVHAQVGFRQQHRGRNTARAVFGSREGVGQLVHRLQAGGVDFAHAARQQLRGLGQPRAVSMAVAQIGGEVQALHRRDCRLFWGPGRGR